MTNLKVGDAVKTDRVSGTIIRIQPKTQDIIVKDEAGNLHICLHSSLSIEKDSTENQ